MFADLVADATVTLFEALSESATYTPPNGGVAVVTRASIDEPNVELPPGVPRSAMRERQPQLILPRVSDPDGAWQGIGKPQRGAVVAVTTVTHGTRTFEIDSLVDADSDRWRVAARETTA